MFFYFIGFIFTEAHELKEFIRERYDPDANIFRATIYKYEPGDAKHFGDGLLLKS